MQRTPRAVTVTIHSMSHHGALTLQSEGQIADMWPHLALKRVNKPLIQNPEQEHS